MMANIMTPMGESVTFKKLLKCKAGAPTYLALALSCLLPCLSLRSSVCRLPFAVWLPLLGRVPAWRCFARASLARCSFQCPLAFRFPRLLFTSHLPPLLPVLFPPAALASRASTLHSRGFAASAVLPRHAAYCLLAFPLCLAARSELGPGCRIWFEVMSPSLCLRPKSIRRAKLL